MYQKVTIKSALFTFLLFFTTAILSTISTSSVLMAQPSNDDCVDAIEIIDLSDVACLSNPQLSGSPTYTMVDATNGGWNASCSVDPQHDVWFKFTAVGKVLDIKVKAPINFKPQIVLMEAQGVPCVDGFTEIDCVSENGSGAQISLNNLNVGTEYYFFVNSIIAADFRLCVVNIEAPPNDDCENAIDLSGMLDNGCDTYTTLGATQQYVDSDGTALGGCTSSDNDVWFTFTAAGPVVSITVDGFVDNFQPEILLLQWDGNTCGAATYFPIECANLPGTESDETLDFTGLSVGEQYYVMVQSTFDNAVPPGDFELCIDNPPAPDGFVPCEAVALTPGDGEDAIPCTGQPSSTINALTDISGGCIPAGFSQTWFSTTLSAGSSVLTIDLTSNSFTSDIGLMIVTNNSTCPTFDPILVYDYCGAAGLISVSGLTDGVEYLIGVGTPDTDEADFDICVEEKAPAVGCIDNQFCVDAELINIPVISLGGTLNCGSSNVFSTNDCNIGANAGLNGVPINYTNCGIFGNGTVWYEFYVPPGSGLFFDFKVESPNMNNPMIAIWAYEDIPPNSDCTNTLSGLTCAAGTGGVVTISELNIADIFSTTGTFMVSVASSTGEEGDFTLCARSYESPQPCTLEAYLFYGDGNGTGTALADTTVLFDTEGNYLPGITVEFCKEVTVFSQQYSNWLHGIIPRFEDGWDLSTLQSTMNPKYNGTTESGWQWTAGGIAKNWNTNETIMEAGWWFYGNFITSCSLPQTNPSSRWGTPNFPGIWVACFELTTPDADCLGAANLGVYVDTYGDNETGGWGCPGQNPNFGCAIDLPTTKPGKMCCIDVPVVVENPTICIGDIIPTLSVDAPGGVGYWYDDPTAGNLIFVGNDYNPAITNPGVYTYYVENVANSSCLSERVPITLTINELDIATIPDIELCKDNPDQYHDLVTYITGLDDGEFVNPSFNLALLPDGTLDLYASQEGNYNVLYKTENDPASVCPIDVSFSLTIYDAPQSGTPVADMPVLCADTDTTISLRSLLEDEEGKGLWEDISANPVPPAALDIDAVLGIAYLETKDLEGGTYEFEYTPPAYGPCVEVSSIVSVTIIPNPDLIKPANDTACLTYDLSIVVLDDVDGNTFDNTAYTIYENENGMPGAELTDPVITFSNNDTTYFFIAGGADCADTTSIDIIIFEDPVVSATNPAAVCNEYDLADMLTNGLITSTNTDLTDPDVEVSFHINNIGLDPVPSTLLGPGNHDLAVVVKNDFGCSGFATFNVEVKLQPELLDITPTPTCAEFDLTTLETDGLIIDNNGSTGATITYHQDDNGAMGQDVTANPIITEAEEGTYWVHYDLDGCTDSTWFEIDVLPQPDMMPFTDVSTCNLPYNMLFLIAQDENQLDYTAPNASVTYHFDGGGAPGTEIPQPNPEAPIAGTYWVCVDIDGCTDCESVEINSGGNPDINPIDPQESCGDLDLTTVPLSDAGTASYGGANITFYDGDPGAGGTQIDPPTATTSGTYWVEVDLGGCSDVASFDVTIKPVPDIEPIADMPTCATLDLSTFVPTDLNGETLDGYFTIHEDNPPGTPGAEITDLTTMGKGTYWVVVDLNGCTDEEPFNITLQGQAALDPIDPITECIFPVEYDLSTITITSGGSDIGSATKTYHENGTNGSGPQLPSPVVTQSGTYWIQVDIGGCLDEVSVDLTINPQPELNTIDPLSNCSSIDLTTDITISDVNGTDYTSATYTYNDADTGSPIADITNITTSTNVELCVDIAGCTDCTTFAANIDGSLCIEPVAAQEDCSEIDLSTITVNECSGADLSTAVITYHNDDGTGTAPGTELNSTIVNDPAVKLYWIQVDLAGCVEAVPVDVNIIGQPNPNPIPDQVACEVFDMTSLEAGLSDQGTVDYSAANITYHDDDGSGNPVSFEMADPGNITQSGTYWFVIDNSTCIGQVPVNITIEPMPNAGVPVEDTVYICNSFGNKITLFNYLSGADTGGEWSEVTDDNPPSAFGGFIPSAGTFDGNFQNPGIYKFEYTVFGVECPNASTIVIVQVSNQPAVQIETSANVCNGGTVDFILNFNSLINSITPNTWGIWDDKDNSGVDLTTLPDIDFTDITPGSYEFEFCTTSAGQGCVDVCENIEILVEDCACPSVAITKPDGICINSGSDISLSNLKVTTEAGVWSVIDGPAGYDLLDLSDNTIKTDDPNFAEGDYTLMFKLTTPPIDPTCPDSSTVILVVSQPLNAGTAEPPMEVCNDNTTPIDLFTLLNGQDAGGIWKETTIPPSGQLNGNSLDPAGIAEGTYTFEYELDATDPCSDAVTEVSVVVDNAPSANIIPTAEICNSPIDLGSVLDFTTLVSGDAGTWTNTDNIPGLDMSNPAAVDFNGVAKGIYTFTYTVAGNGACQDLILTTSLTVKDCNCPDVTVDPTPIILCEGQTFDLTNIQSTTEAGTWAVVPAGGPSINGTQLNTSTGNAGDYVVFFQLDTPPVDPTCDDRSVDVPVKVEATPEAGTGGTVSVCNTETGLIDLNAELSGQNPNGTWTLDSGTLDDPDDFIAGNGTFDPEGHSAQSLVFNYEVTGTACPADNAQVTVEVSTPNTATVTPNATICNSTIDIGNILNMDALVTAGDMTGTWMEDTGLNLGVDLTTTSAVDFLGITPGNYSFTYTTAANGTCAGQTYTVSVLVEDCQCPSVALTDLTEVCVGAGISYNLDDQKVTTEDGSWTITNGPTGYDLITLTGENTFDTNDPNVAEGTYEFTFTLTTAPSDPTCAESAAITLDIALPVSAGTSNGDLDICNDQTTPIVLADLLNGQDAGGAWTVSGASQNQPDTDAFDGTEFKPDGHSEASITFVYTINATTPCTDDTEEVTINVGTYTSAGTINTPSVVCQDSVVTINLFDLLDNEDIGGTWTVATGSDTPASGLDLATGMFTPENNPVATYQFTYSMNNTGSCPASDATVSVTVQDCDCPNVTTYPAAPLCNDGDVLDLANLQDAGIDLGIWTLIDPSGNDVTLNNGTEFDPSGMAAGDYVATYTLTTPEAGCDEFSTQTISVSAYLSSGTANVASIDLCNDETTAIVMMDYLDNADPNGTWSVSPAGNQTIGFDETTGVFDPAGHAAANIIIVYEHDNADPCADASTEITINISESVSAGTFNGTALEYCNDDVTNIVLSDYLDNADPSGTWTVDPVPNQGFTGTDFVADGVDPNTYTFTYTVTGSGVCGDDSESYAIVVKDCSCPDVTTIAPTDDLCNDSGTLDLTTLEGATIDPGTWSIEPSGNANEPQLTSETIFDATGADAGSYTVTYTLDNPIVNCPESSSQTIVVVQAANSGTFTGNTPQPCHDEVAGVDLNTLLTGADANGTWTVSGTSPTNPVTGPDANGNFVADGNPVGMYDFTYTVTGTVPCGDVSTTVSLEIIDCSCTDPAPPTVVAGPDLTMCDGDDIPTFEVSSAANTIVKWYDDDYNTNNAAVQLSEGLSYKPKAAGTYYAIAFNDPEDACNSTTVTFTLDITPLPDVTLNLSSDVVCLGEDLILSATGYTAGATLDWDYGSAGTSTDETATVEYANTGQETITLTVTENGCSNTFTEVVNINDVTVASNVINETINVGESIDISIDAQSLLDGAIDYVWDGVSSSTQETYTPEEDMSFVVEVTDEYGCTELVDVNITVIKENIVTIPNAFSPNGDFVNDMFTIQGVNISTIEMKVYNRWGNEIYMLQTSDLSQGWDGRHDDTDVDVGVLCLLRKS